MSDVMTKISWTSVLQQIPLKYALASRLEICEASKSRPGKSHRITKQGITCDKSPHSSWLL